MPFKGWLSALMPLSSCTCSVTGVIRIKTSFPWSDRNSQQKSHKNEKAGQVRWHSGGKSRGQFLGAEASLLYRESSRSLRVTLYFKKNFKKNQNIKINN